MHFWSTFKQYFLEYALINKVRISVLKHKKQELFNSKWPCFINLCRIQIILGIIQLIVNIFILNTQNSSRPLFYDIVIALAQNIMDRCIFIRVNENKKFVLIALLNISHCIYLTTVTNFLRKNDQSQEQTSYIELIYRLMFCVVLINIQPLIICKFLIFVYYYSFVCYYLQAWDTNFYDFIVILMIFVLYTVQEEGKFRKLIRNSIIPNQIINAIPLPVFLIKLSSLEIIAFNLQFQKQLKEDNLVFGYDSHISISSIQKFLTKFQLSGNQSLFNILDTSHMNLYEAISLIKIKTETGLHINSTFNYQFSIDETQMFNILFQSGIVFNDDQCILISISDISAIIERTKLNERTALKSQLIKSLSHELRTRKNIIQGLLKLYLDQNEKHTELILQAYNNSKIESNIISSIINYNLCLEDSVVVNYSLVKVNALMDKVIDTFTYEAQQKQINILQNYYPETDYSLFTDSEIFEQIITNIISNSIKHCDKVTQSFISISISKETCPRSETTSNQKHPYRFHKKSQYSSFLDVDESQDTLEKILNIKIIDNGSGISPNKLRLIEEILKNDNFYQFSSQSDGFYLGLRSCNLLLQKLNKKKRVFISMQSTEEQGTEVTLRFVMPDLKSSEFTISFEDAIQYVRVSRQQRSIIENCECMRTILIVDDEPFNNIILEQILVQLGFKVIKANNGYEALKLYKQQAMRCQNEQCRLFYAIFMDYQMPIMNGLESTKAIINECLKIHHPQTNIIGCTAFSAKEDINELLKAGMKNVCIKPISKDSIKQSLTYYQ